MSTLALPATMKPLEQAQTSFKAYLIAAFQILKGIAEAKATAIVANWRPNALRASGVALEPRGHGRLRVLESQRALLAWDHQGLVCSGCVGYVGGAVVVDRSLGSPRGCVRGPPGRPVRGMRPTVPTPLPKMRKSLGHQLDQPIPTCRLWVLSSVVVPSVTRWIRGTAPSSQTVRISSICLRSGRWSSVVPMGDAAGLVPVLELTAAGVLSADGDGGGVVMASRHLDVEGANGRDH
jgi:hypothetical protein